MIYEDFCHSERLLKVIWPSDLSSKMSSIECQCSLFLQMSWIHSTNPVVDWLKGVNSGQLSSSASVEEPTKRSEWILVDTIDTGYYYPKPPGDLVCGCQLVKLETLVFQCSAQNLLINLAPCPFCIPPVQQVLLLSHLLLRRFITTQH